MPRQRLIFPHHFALGDLLGLRKEQLQERSHGLRLAALQLGGEERQGEREHVVVGRFGWQRHGYSPLLLLEPSPVPAFHFRYTPQAYPVDLGKVAPLFGRTHGARKISETFAIFRCCARLPVVPVGCAA